MNKLSICVTGLLCSTGLAYPGSRCACPDMTSPSDTIIMPGLSFIINDITSSIELLSWGDSQGHSYQYPTSESKDTASYSYSKSTTRISVSRGEKPILVFILDNTSPGDSYSVVSDFCDLDNDTCYNRSASYTVYSNGNKAADGRVWIKDNPETYAVIGMWQSYGELTREIDTVFFDLPYPLSFIPQSYEDIYSVKGPKWKIDYVFNEENRTLDSFYEICDGGLSFEYSRTSRFMLYGGKPNRKLVEIGKGIKRRVPYCGFLIEYYDNGSKKASGEIYYDVSPEIDYIETGAWTSYCKDIEAMPYKCEYDEKDGILHAVTFYDDNMPLARYELQGNGSYIRITDIHQHESTSSHEFYGNKFIIGTDGVIAHPGLSRIESLCAN